MLQHWPLCFILAPFLFTATSSNQAADTFGVILGLNLSDFKPIAILLSQFYLIGHLTNLKSKGGYPLLLWFRRAGNPLGGVQKVVFKVMRFDNLSVYSQQINIQKNTPLNHLFALHYKILENPTSFIQMWGIPSILCHQFWGLLACSFEKEIFRSYSSCQKKKINEGQVYWQSSSISVRKWNKFWQWYWYNLSSAQKCVRYFMLYHLR